MATNNRRKVRILITGSTGQLGRELIRVFAKDELLLLSRDDIDVRDPKLEQRIVSLLPEIIIHTAAYTDVDGCERNPTLAYQVNTVGSRNVISGAEKIGAKLVYISTDYVFDGEKGTPYVESDHTSPINLYGKSKLMGEELVMASSVKWIIVRTARVYGKGKRNFVSNVIQWTESLPVLKLARDKTGSPTYARDLAYAIKHLVNVEASGLFHVAGQGACTWYEYGKKILGILNVKKAVIPIGFDELNRPAKRPNYSALSSQKLKEIGFEMRNWDIALKEFLLDTSLK